MPAPAYVLALHYDCDENTPARTVMSATGQPEALCGIGINFRADKTGALLVSSLIEGGIYADTVSSSHLRLRLSDFWEVTLRFCCPVLCSLPGTIPAHDASVLSTLTHFSEMKSKYGCLRMEILMPTFLSRLLGAWQDRLGNRERFKRATSCTRYEVVVW